MPETPEEKPEARERTFDELTMGVLADDKKTNEPPEKTPAKEDEGGDPELLRRAEEMGIPRERAALYGDKLPDVLRDLDAAVLRRHGEKETDDGEPGDKQKPKEKEVPKVEEIPDLEGDDPLDERLVKGFKAIRTRLSAAEAMVQQLSQTLSLERFAQQLEAFDAEIAKLGWEDIFGAGSSLALKDERFKEKREQVWVVLQKLRIGPDQLMRAVAAAFPEEMLRRERQRIAEGAKRSTRGTFTAAPTRREREAESGKSRATRVAEEKLRKMGAA